MAGDPILFINLFINLRGPEGAGNVRGLKIDVRWYICTELWLLALNATSTVDTLPGPVGQRRGTGDVSEAIESHPAMSIGEILICLQCSISLSRLASSKNWVRIADIISASNDTSSSSLLSEFLTVV